MNSKHRLWKTAPQQVLQLNTKEESDYWTAKVLLHNLPWHRLNQCPSTTLQLTINHTQTRSPTGSQQHEWSSRCFGIQSPSVFLKLCFTLQTLVFNGANKSWLSMFMSSQKKLLFSSEIYLFVLWLLFCWQSWNVQSQIEGEACYKNNISQLVGNHGGLFSREMLDW